MNIELENIIPFLPEIFLFTTASLCLILGLYKSFSKAVWWIAGTAIIGILLFIVNNLPILVTREEIFGGIIIDPITIILKIVILCFAALILLFYGGLTRVKVWGHGHHEFVVLVLLASIGAMVAISARNFLIAYIALELISLVSYILASYDRKNKYSAEAGMKYFIMGSLSSCMMVFGMSYIYGFSGSLLFSDISILFVKNLYSIGLIAGICIFICGLFFKLSIFPFHFWTPDIYQGSPFISVAFFTSIPKLTAVLILINITNGVLEKAPEYWKDFFITLAILSMIIGALGAIKQNSIKRLMGYSTVMNLGFVLFSIATDSTKGFASAIIYQIIYSIASIGLFAALNITIIPDAEDYTIDNLLGYGVVKKLAAFSLSIFMFSMAGIPPLAGFFVKYYVIESAVNASLYIPVILALLASVIAAFYYINIVKLMYFCLPTERQIRLHESSALAFVIALCTGITLLFPILQAIL